MSVQVISPTARRPLWTQPMLIANLGRELENTVTGTLNAYEAW